MINLRPDLINNFFPRFFMMIFQFYFSIARLAKPSQRTQGLLYSLRPLRFIAFFAIQKSGEQDTSRKHYKPAFGNFSFLSQSFSFKICFSFFQKSGSPFFHIFCFKTFTEFLYLKIISLLCMVKIVDTFYHL